ncbi:hypothetical protein VTP01DRAFT_202 [Rhizomucor pusillus]|uniref:uncharacterized protein n=1 Tax=Rhizomucor pusillus TaxID=4840 RepID=UPI0037430778
MSLSAVASELVPVSPTFQHCIAEQDYIFGGCYPIAYYVDPASDDPLEHRFSQKEFNVSDKAYSYNMLTDEWTFETTTPYPLQYAYTTVVDDLIYLFDPKFESNETRPNEGWTYNTSSKAWRYVTRMPFVYIGRLRTCMNNGKIYMTGANDGMQINVIQVYDTRTNEWEEPILITDYQLNIHKLICKDSAILAIGEQVKKEKSVVSIPGKRELHNAKVFTLHRNGSVQKDVWAIDYYQMHQSVVQDSVMYLLDHKDEEQYVPAKVNIDTHERQELVVHMSDKQNKYSSERLKKIFARSTIQNFALDK